MAIFLFFRLNYDFIHSIEAEMSQEQQETNGTRFDGANTMNLMIDHGHVLPPRRTIFIRNDFRFWPLDDESMAMDDHN